MSKITKAAGRTDVLRVRSLFYGSAREAFGDFLGNLNLRNGEGILLPAFIGWSPREGSGVFDPVEESKLPYGFYAPRPDLTVDLERLEDLLREGCWRVLVVIHYWGRVEPQLAEISALAERYGAILVEDLAHGFFSAARGAGGQMGSINLYSLHKMFAMPDGGMIVYRDPLLITHQKETRPDLARQILDYSWPLIGDIRRRNFFLLKDKLSKLPERGTEFDFIWTELSPLEVPQSLPVIILNGHRDKIYTAMNLDGYGMTSLYHTLIEGIAHAFPAMQALSQSITNFPVHQDCDQSAFDSMVESFRVALRS